MSFIIRFLLKLVIGLTIIAGLAYYGLKKIGVEDPLLLLLG